MELTLAPPGMRRRKDEAPSEAFLLKTEPESGPAPGDRGHVKKKKRAETHHPSQHVRHSTGTQASFCNK